jgi:hypothetical protein
VPRGQFAQLVAPAAAANVPAAHGTQLGAPAAEYAPAGQSEQLSDAAAPAVGR